MENRPADINTHLANDRTYLAYLRTAVALVSFGITVNRFSLYLLQSEVISAHKVSQGALSQQLTLVDLEQVGIWMVVLGMFLLLWAAIYHTRTSKAIENHNFRPARLQQWVLTIAVLAFGCFAIIGLFQR